MAVRIYSGDMENWRCPICACPIYESVTVSKPSGARYRTEFFRCSACSVMFCEPGLFNRLAIDTLDRSKYESKMHSDRSLLNQSLIYRYWEARLTREGGGFPPKPEAVSEAMRTRGFK